MEIRREIPEYFGKIRSVIMIMAQDRRIRSNELDDLNQTLRRLTEQVEMLLIANESMEQEAIGIKQLKRQHADLTYKMGVCLELSGLSNFGIKYLMSFPISFLELILAIRARSGSALEAEKDFLWMNMFWKGLNLKIENDFESFKQAIFLKQIFHQSRDPDVRKQTINAMNGYVEDLAYLKSKLGKEIEDKELLNLITEHWYETYRHYTSQTNGRGEL